MQRIWHLVDGVAPTDATVLIQGESGTGKEVIARTLHRHSPRSARAFVAVNCGAVVATLAESELFGHERGAFSGATDRRIGVFEAANGGTLLLDEVSELPLALQSKLLRVIQEREVIRVGSTRPQHIDVRIVATSNRDLVQMVGDGTFREDLFYRLNVFPLRVPPLRDRISDLPYLAHAIADSLARRSRRSRRLPVDGESILTPDGINALATHPWPGNVRELHNVIERCLVFAPHGRIDSGTVRQALGLRAGVATTLSLAATKAPTATLAQVEQDLIVARLETCSGNRTHAAKSLGISIRTLRNKLRDYRQRGVSFPQPGSGL